MAQIVIMYKLQSGVTQDQFHNWVRTVDYPAMRALARVDDFRTYRCDRHLMDAEAPSVDYVEVFQISDLDGFLGEDMAGETVQKIMGEFMGFAAAPEFIICEEVK